VKCPRVRCLCVKRVQVKKCKQKMVWSKHVGKIIWLKIKKKYTIKGSLGEKLLCKDFWNVRERVNQRKSY
jgi:hypothetical protein